MFTAESREHVLAFEPQPTDVIISPAAKCGTTWLQQITHGLRTRGHMDFEEITVMVPWLEVAHVAYAVIVAENTGTGRVVHIVGGETPQGVRVRAICWIGREWRAALTRCTHECQVLTDTWHATVEEAKREAHAEFEGLEWPLRSRGFQ